MTSGTDEHADLETALTELVGDEGSVGSDGAPEATEAEAPAEEAVELPGKVGNVDVSWMSDEQKGVLSQLPPETAEVVATAMNREKAVLVRGANQRFEEAAKLRKEAEALEVDAQFGKAIQSNPELMKRVMALGGAEQVEEEDDTSLFDLPEDKFVGKLANKMNLPTADKIQAMIEEGVQKALGNTPMMRDQALVNSANQYWSEKAAEYPNLTQEMRVETEQMAVQALRNRGMDPREKLSQDLPAYFDAWLEVALAKNGTAKPAPNVPPSLKPTPSSGGPAAGTKPLSLRERLKRKPTDEEIWLDPQSGGSAQELEEALERYRKGE